MTRPAIEVADILRGLGPALRDGLSRDQHRAVNAILSCRTAALGGHVSRCEDCGTMDVAYNSCRNRHCTRCQAAASYEWLEARRRDLLPVAYYHVVFTLPAPLARVAFQSEPLVRHWFKPSGERVSSMTPCSRPCPRP
jgi:hypothetical protein